MPEPLRIEVVPEVWVRQAHAMAESCREDASLVVDGSTEKPDDAAARILASLQDKRI